MKPFNLQEAIAGKPICDRLGRDVMFVDYVKEEQSSHKLVCLNFVKKITTYTAEGRAYSSSSESNYDLFMVATKKNVWANLYTNNTFFYYDTEAEANNSASPTMNRLNGKAQQIEIED